MRWTLKNINNLSLIFLIWFVSCNHVTSESEKSLLSNKNKLDSLTFVKQSLTSVYRLPTIPKQMTFAGEKVPLENQEVRSKLLRELIIHANRHSKTLIMLREKSFWEQHVTSILKENGVPKDFFYLAIAESELDNNAISPVKAAGMWQLMKETAKEYGLKVNKQIDERRNPDKATRVACIYLKEAKVRFNTWANAAASYNRGMSGLQRALTNQKVSSVYQLYLNPETSRYLYRILAIKLLFENPENYGFNILEKDKIAPITIKKVRLEKGNYNTVDLAKSYGLTYAELKKYNPWLIDASDYQLKNTSEELFLFLPNH